MIDKAMPVHIKNLFEDVFYSIPEYQREYSWKLKNWENLFGDIDDSEKDYFLGTLICIVENDGSMMKVVDGQQRLTTLSIFRLALFNKLQGKKLEFAENENYYQIYLNLKSSLQKNSENKLQLQSKNKEEYETLIGKVIHNDDDKIDNRRRIFKAYNFFEEKISDYSVDDIFELLGKVNEALVVRIEVKTDQDAFILFESINNRGMPLSPIDLIKNKMFAQLAKDKIGDIEDHNTKWQKIIDNIEDFNDQVRFLRHYYHAFQHKDNIKIKRFKKATKTNLIEIYSELIENDVEFIFEEMQEKSKTYKIFTSPDNIDDSKSYSAYKEQLKNLQRLGIAPAYALMLYLFSEHKGKDFANLMLFLENWFIRRQLTNFPGTNKLDQIFLDLIGEIDKSGDYSFEFIKDYLSHEDYYKSDDEIKKALVSTNLYDDNFETIRYLLIQLEIDKREKNDTKEVSKDDFWKVEKKKSVWTIEHIMPQTPKKDSDWFRLIPDEETRESYVHKLGNLTLTRYNQTLSNISFSEKINKMTKDGKQIGLKSGNILINEYIKDKDDDRWTVEDIEKRGEDLADKILELLDRSRNRCDGV
ncbi:MAG: DUF262 domain-containing HNH endonuclease family protein [Sulfurovum sp.]|nr:DUF262 domain-containing HNH endonuclease family protein [Sulfurovum sp.]